MSDKKKFHNVKDPFNPENEVSGWFDRTRYDLLHITEVNGEKCNQIIHVTPKFHYPYTKDGNSRIPKNVHIIDEHIKYDGTNICQFMYKNADYESFVSYRTRGMLFMSERYEELVKEVLEKYNILHLPFDLHCNLGYELYGYKNFHEIIYDEPLDLALLYGINQNTGELIAPRDITVWEVPKAKTKVTMMPSSDHNFITEVYEKRRKEMEEKLEITDNGIKGLEGVVWYLGCSDDQGEFFTKAFKVKPPTIMKMHTVRAGSFPYGAVRTTIRNASEDQFPVEFEYVCDLLTEDFAEAWVNKYREKIKRLTNELNHLIQLEQDVIEMYKENKLENLSKGDMMRWFAKEVGNKNTTKVYNILKRYKVFVDE